MKREAGNAKSEANETYPRSKSVNIVSNNVTGSVNLSVMVNSGAITTQIEITAPAMKERDIVLKVGKNSKNFWITNLRNAVACGGSN
jgi:hypothetical protein